MIPEQALALAGPGAVLAARPAGVAHVYTGPLTPSERFIPRAARVVCRARTRRLHVVTIPQSWSSLLPPEARAGHSLPRLCARCSVCLARRRGLIPASVSSPPGQAEQPSTRDQYRRTYADLTAADLVVAAHCATSPDEVDQVAHLSLVLLGHRACTEPAALPSGRCTTSVHTAIAARRRETPHPDVAHRAALADAGAEHARQIRIARAQELKAARDRKRAPRLNPSGAPR